MVYSAAAPASAIASAVPPAKSAPIPAGTSAAEEHQNILPSNWCQQQGSCCCLTVGHLTTRQSSIATFCSWPPALSPTSALLPERLHQHHQQPSSLHRHRPRPSCLHQHCCHASCLCQHCCQSSWVQYVSIAIRSLTFASIANNATINAVFNASCVC